MLCRSSQISEFKACPRSAYYRYNLGLVPTGGKKNPHLFFGKALHKAVDLFHKHNVDRALDFIDELEWTDSRTKTKARAKSLLKIYATNNIIELISTEETFEFALGRHTWRGRFDGIGKYGNYLWVIEHKTTKPAYLIAKPNDQAMAYWVGATKLYNKDIYGVLINLFDVDKLEVHTFPVTFSAAEYNAWYNEILLLLDYYEHCYNTKTFPSSPEACYRYRLPCAYMPICTADHSTKKVIIERCYAIDKKAKTLSW